MKQFTAILALLALAAPGVATAQMGKGLRAGTTRAGAVAAAAKTFRRYDANGDGAVDAAEMTAVLQARAEKGGKTFKPKRATRMLARYDGDHDGKATLAEFQAAAGASFDAADLNKNGTIDADEAKGGGAKAGAAEG